MSAPHRPDFGDEDLRELAALDPAAITSSAGLDKQKILARVTTNRPSTDLRRGRSRFVHPLRFVGVAAVAAALAALFIIAPFGSKDSVSAFATWTPIPRAISPDMDRILDGYCDTPRPHAEETGTTSKCEIVAKEQRGEVGFVAARTATGSLKTAIFVGEKKVLGSVAQAPDPSDELKSEEVHTVTRAASTPLPDEPHEVAEHSRLLVTTLIGLVGSNVTAVEIAVNPEISDPAASEMFPVQATVENGMFAAWWPGKEEIAYEPENGLVFNVTLTSGEVLKNVPIFAYYEED